MKHRNSLIADDDEEFQRLLEGILPPNSKNYDSEDDEDSDEEPDSDDDYEEFPQGAVQQKPPKFQAKVSFLWPFEHPEKELDRLVGCQDIRRRMDELLKMSRYNRLMRLYNPEAKEHKLSLHCVFQGRPGTGKSTVARILGSLLRQAGVLTKGHVVVCNRSTFVGSNWGDEESAVSQVLEMARGGVLMIDEAYLLSTPHPNDPGKLVLQLLMDQLADEQQRDFAVVICGYKDEIQGLLNLNPGLESRFPNRFEFPDFTVGELMEIAQRRVSEYGYHFTRAARQKLSHIISEAYDNRDERTWGNARYIANLLEKVYTHHAIRCVNLRNPSQSRLLTIVPSDIVPLEELMPVKSPVSQRIRVAGFSR